MKRAISLSIPSLLFLGCGDAEVPTGWDPIYDDPEDQAFAASPDPDETTDSPVALAPQVTVFTSDQYSVETPPPVKDAFSLSETQSIYFYAYFPDLDPGNHVAVLEIDGPDGYTYRTLSVPFYIGTDMTVGVTPTEMGFQVVLELPVADTNISQYSLTGDWAAHLLLDVVAGPALFENTFEIY